MNCHRFLSAAAVAGFLALASFASAQRTIVVDAGHGGHDRGGVPYQRIGEKGMTLDVSQRLRRVLEGRGYRVIMTRNSDVFVPLGTRVAIANRYRGATFVSVHFNSSRRAGANGVETYYYRSDSASLAASIHRNVVAGAPTENRGIRRRGFYVLRRTSIPSVLVECGFLTNPQEGRLAQSASYRQLLAERIARGIARQPAPFQRPLTPSLVRAGMGPAGDFVRPSAVAERRSRASKSRKSRASRKAAARKKAAAKARKKKAAAKKKSEG
ncbi:MAG TPA: N-acetylmuramoyl-L-alanine amidase [Chthoniobacterales bacterium]|nr:N-acetylmuramoyl-L-alanine amidase [Chthoniobacterales bacterium]